MWRRLFRVWPAVGLLVAAGAWEFYGAKAPSCEVLPKEAMPNVVRRADELLQLLRSQWPRFLAETTAEFQGDHSRQQLDALREALLPFLGTLRLQGIWHLENTYLRRLLRRDQGVAVCNANGRSLAKVTALGEFESVAILHYDAEHGPLVFRVTLQLKRNDDRWRADGLTFAPVRDRGRDATFYEQLADRRFRRGKELDALLAYIAANLLSFPPPNVQTQEYARVRMKLEEATRPYNLDRVLARERIPREHAFLDVALDVIAGEGLVPRFSFASSKRGAASSEDAHALFDALQRAAPGLREDFTLAVMTAYEPQIGKSALASPPTAGSHESYTTMIRFDGLPGSGSDSHP